MRGHFGHENLPLRFSPAPFTLPAVALNTSLVCSESEELLLSAPPFAVLGSVRRTKRISTVDVATGVRCSMAALLKLRDRSSAEW